MEQNYYDIVCQYCKKHSLELMTLCYTYNHSLYIKKALESFASQTTSFPFVCVVIDDNSVDGNQEKIMTFLKNNCNFSLAENFEDETSYVIFIPHSTNQNCFYAICLLKENLYQQKEKKRLYVTPWRENCKYEAFCEGDDYWIDNSKLEFQVSFLNANKTYGMCYTKCKRYIQEKKTFEIAHWGGKNESFEDFIYRGNTVPTLTSVYHTKLILQYYEEIDTSQCKWKMSDYPWWLYISYNSKIKFLDCITGVYRVLRESGSHFPKKEDYISFIESSIDISKYFISHFNYSIDIEEYINIKKTRLSTNLVSIYNDREGAIKVLKSVKSESIIRKLKMFIFSSKELTHLYRYWIRKWK